MVLVQFLFYESYWDEGSTQHHPVSMREKFNVRNTNDRNRFKDSTNDEKNAPFASSSFFTCLTVEMRIPYISHMAA